MTLSSQEGNKFLFNRKVEWGSMVVNCIIVLNSLLLPYYKIINLFPKPCSLTVLPTVSHPHWHWSWPCDFLWNVCGYDLSRGIKKVYVVCLSISDSQNNSTPLAHPKWDTKHTYSQPKSGVKPDWPSRQEICSCRSTDTEVRKIDIFNWKPLNSGVICVTLLKQ